MELFVLGLSHRTAPVALRERLAVEGDALKHEVNSLVHDAKLDEAVMISTCNRVEIYAVARDVGHAAHAARTFLASRATPDALEGVLYEHRGPAAVRHAFRVAASLDSMVLGEPQILGQVKRAFGVAVDVGSVGALLGRCFPRAFAVAKRVRSETGIAAGLVSVSSIACELAESIWGSLDGRRVLLVGAGKMGESAAKHLAKQGARLVVMNRSPERAEALANASGGVSRRMEELESELVHADVVITSTSSTEFVIRPDLVQRVMKARRHRQVFFIDIAVPRDIDPRVGNLENVLLYDVDDLKKVAESTLAQRRKEAERAEQIVEHEVREFEQWRRTAEIAPTILALRERVKSTVEREVARTASRLGPLDDEGKRALGAMTDAIVNKVLHHPTMELRRLADSEDGARMLETVHALFDLGGKKGPAPSLPPPDAADRHARGTTTPDGGGEDP